MIESRGYFVGYKEVDAVVDKMDTNKDGRRARARATPIGLKSVPLPGLE